LVGKRVSRSARNTSHGPLPVGHGHVDQPFLFISLLDHARTVTGPSRLFLACSPCHPSLWNSRCSRVRDRSPRRLEALPTVRGGCLELELPRRFPRLLCCTAWLGQVPTSFDFSAPWQNPRAAGKHVSAPRSLLPREEACIHLTTTNGLGVSCGQGMRRRGTGMYSYQWLLTADAVTLSPLDIISRHSRIYTCFVTSDCSGQETRCSSAALAPCHVYLGESTTGLQHDSRLWHTLQLIPSHWPSISRSSVRL
jgi:hypothetical protein